MVTKVIYQRNGEWKDMKGLMNALKDEGAFVQYRVV
jgi:predicted transcriptional regulator